MANIREDFCAACVAAPVALLSSGTAISSTSNFSITMFWVSLLITFISAIVYFSYKDCKTCSF